MVNNGTQIRQSVSIGDVATVLGTNSSDVGTLCTHANVNKWAIYKPEKSNKMFLTLEDRIANKCSMSPKTCPTLKSHIYPICANSDTRTMNTTELVEWTYTKPTGGASSPYRLGDFLDLDRDFKPTVNGYNHDAVAPDSGWGNLSCDLTNVKNVCDGTFTTSGTGTAFTLTSANSWVLVNNVDFRFDETSASLMGSANSKYMPLSYITGALITTTEYLRLCYLVWIPYTLSGAKANYWIMFTGKKPLRAINPPSNSIGDMLPNLASNQYGAELLKYNRETKNVATFTCCPVLVRNVTSTTITANSKNMLCLTFANDSNALVYSMPSGAKTFDFNITNNQGHSMDSTDISKFTGINIHYKIGKKDGVTWYIGFRSTGTNAVYQTTYNIYLITDSTSPVSATITGTLNYVTNPTGSSPLSRLKVYNNQSFTASTAVPFKAGGGDYYAHSLDGGVNMSYVSCDMTLK